MLYRIQCPLPKLNDYILLMHNQHSGEKLHGAGDQVSEEDKVRMTLSLLCVSSKP